MPTAASTASGAFLDQLWAADSGANAFNPLEEYKYGYDADGNVLSQENKNAESLSNAYLYDAANRLINWAQGVTQMKTYSYDSVGNNIDSSSTGGKYNSDNEETTINNGGLSPTTTFRQHADVEQRRHGGLRRLGPAGRGGRDLRHRRAVRV